MVIFDIVKKLCDEKDIKISVLERDLGFSRGSVYKMMDSAPSADKVKKLADYFDVSADYLIGRTSDNNENIANITFNELFNMYTACRIKLSPDEKIKLAQIILADCNEEQTK